MDEIIKRLQELSQYHKPTALMEAKLTGQAKADFLARMGKTPKKDSDEECDKDDKDCVEEEENDSDEELEEAAAGKSGRKGHKKFDDEDDDTPKAKPKSNKPPRKIKGEDLDEGKTFKDNKHVDKGSKEDREKAKELKNKKKTTRDAEACNESLTTLANWYLRKVSEQLGTGSEFKAFVQKLKEKASANPKALTEWLKAKKYPTLNEGAAYARMSPLSQVNILGGKSKDDTSGQKSTLSTVRNPKITKVQENTLENMPVFNKNSSSVNNKGFSGIQEQSMDEYAESFDRMMQLCGIQKAKPLGK